MFYKKYLKRGLDIFLCSLALIVFFPVLIITAIAIKCSSPGPIFYYSERAGKNKKAFRFYKFRSMHVVSEKYKQKDLYTADEERLFFVGKLIRRLKIDELPQLLNVIRGDMSIVGPRPMPMSSVDRQYSGKYEEIMSVKPGLTSIASLYDYTIGEQYANDEDAYRKIIVPNKLELELLYIEKQSFWYDAELIWRTIKTIIMVSVGFKQLPEHPELKEIENEKR